MMLIEEAPISYPRITLLPGHDFSVAAWTWTHFKRHPMMVNRAFGILEEGKLVGSIIFSEWNSINVEGSYYGTGAITAGIVRSMARFALESLGVDRVTFKIPRNNKRMAKQLRKYGAKVECVLQRFYGRTDGNQHAALQYVMFREQLVRIAGPTYRRAKMH